MIVRSERTLLRQWLVSRYDELRRRLTRRLGSDDAATEVLHETWLRLGQVGEVGVIRKPDSYLYRMALNVAVDRGRAETRWARKAQIEALLSSESDELDPEHVATMRSEMAALERALSELPARSRGVFMAALIEELPYREIAERFGISLRSVEREVSRAFDHCAKSMEKSPARRRIAPRGNVLEMKSSRAHVAKDNDED